MLPYVSNNKWQMVVEKHFSMKWIGWLNESAKTIVLCPVCLLAFCVLLHLVHAMYACMRCWFNLIHALLIQLQIHGRLHAFLRIQFSENSMIKFCNGNGIHHDSLWALHYFVNLSFCIQRQTHTHIYALYTSPRLLLQRQCTIWECMCVWKCST